MSVGDRKVALDFGVSTTGDGVHDWGLRATTLVIFEATQSRHFDQYRDGMCSQFQAYLSFAVGRPIFYLAMNGKWRDTSEESSEVASVKILFGQRYVSDRYVRPLERTLFGLYDVENGFERTFKGWVERAELLRPVYELYLGSYYNPATYIDQQFLNLAQALESYHRRVCGGQYMSKEAYGTISASLSKAIDASVSDDQLELREALKNRIRYGYEFTFRSRLRDLVERHKHALTGVLSEAFVDDVVATRNFFTHYDEELRRRAKISATELFYLAQEAKILLQACLLSEVGFTNEEIMRVLPRSEAYALVRFGKRG
jgi:hypothetical protein